MKINNETRHCVNSALYKALSLIPFDIEAFDFKVNELFKNVRIEWDHIVLDDNEFEEAAPSRYVYKLEIANENKIYHLMLDNGFIHFDNNDIYGALPIIHATEYDFIRMCQLCEIELVLTDYAVFLLMEQEKNGRKTK